MNRTVRTYGGMGLIAGVAALLIIFIRPPASRPDTAAYRIVPVTRGSLHVSIQSTGTVQPENRLEIKPPIAGRIESVLVNEGESVERGQLLAWMSSIERAALLDAARAKGAGELARWEEYYRPTPIFAPIAGTIILRNVEPGQTFSNQDAVFVLSDRLTVKAQVDETDIAKIRLEQSAAITLDAYPEEVIAGTVAHIAYDATTVNNVTTYIVDVLPQNAPAFMRSGMTVNVSFSVLTKEGVLLVPAEALQYRQGQPYVLVAAGEGPPEERAVQLGVTDGAQSEVRSGLNEGDKLAVTEKVSAEKGRKGNPFSPFGQGRR